MNHETCNLTCRPFACDDGITVDDQPCKCPDCHAVNQQPDDIDVMNIEDARGDL